MTAILTKEEDDIKVRRKHSISKVTTKDGTNQKKKNFFEKGNRNLQFKKGRTNVKAIPSSAIRHSNGAKVEGFKGKCNFCHKFGHKKVDCRNFKAYLEKKGNYLVMVCLESDIIDVLSNTWWLDTVAIIHVTNSLQVVISKRRPTNLEHYVYIGDDTRLKVLSFWDGQIAASHVTFYGVA